MKTNLKLNQNGRSMVEMLGVMAIIGVISVVGLQGYTVAMNKHRANEILNEASKRAIVVAAQIASGRTPNLGEFPDNEVGGAEFSTTVEKVDGNKFKIGYVSGKEPSEAVKKQMKNIAGTNGMTQGFTGGLTYNNDLSTDSTGSEGGNTPTCVSDTSLCVNGSTDGCTCDVADQTETCTTWMKAGVCQASCPENATCDGTAFTCNTGYHINDTEDGCLPDCTTWMKAGVCQASCPENATCDGTAFTCNTGYDINTTGDGCTIICPTGTTWDGEGTASIALENGHCICTSWKEIVCGSGYYCDFSGKSCTSGNPNGTGVCKPVDGTYRSTTITAKQSRGHWYTKNEMNQWSANSWCLGKTGKGLIGITTLQSIAGTSVVIKAGYFYMPSTGLPLYNGFGQSLSGSYWIDCGVDSTSCTSCIMGVRSTYEAIDDKNKRNSIGINALCE